MIHGHYADAVKPNVRSRMIAGGRDGTMEPDPAIRLRAHRKDLPGKTDPVFPKHGAAILLHGRFRHGHRVHPCR